MRKILILGASDFQLPAIMKAKEMGLAVGVADMNPDAVGIPYADEFFCVSTIDEQGVLKAAEDYGADGIVTLCTDMPMRALAYTCEKLGLPGLDYRSAVNATDKYEMIKVFEEKGVAHPGFVLFHKGDRIESIKSGIRYPVVTKPIDNSGSRGIMVAYNADELDAAVEYSSANGRGGDVIIEEYMQGHEVSVELMVIDGQPHVLQITDKYTSGWPHFVEVGHSQPSELPEDVKEKIADLAARAAVAVGIKNGAGHAEIMVTEDGPKMVEIGARMGGGCITTHLVPLSTGIDMIKATIDVALGQTPDIKEKFSKGSAIQFLLPKPGTVKKIEGVAEAKKIPGVVEIAVDCKIGDILGELENGTSRIGYIIAQAGTAEEARNICKRAHSVINIEIEG